MKRRRLKNPDPKEFDKQEFERARRAIKRHYQLAVVSDALVRQELAALERRLKADTLSRYDEQLIALIEDEAHSAAKVNPKHRRAVKKRSSPTARAAKRLGRVRRKAKRNPTVPLYGIYAKKGAGPVMHFDGEKFSTNGHPKTFTTSDAAAKRAYELVEKHPLLSGYRISVDTARRVKRPGK